MFKQGRQGCGAALRAFSYAQEDEKGVELVTYLECCKPECDYREYLPQRKTTPLLSLEAIPPDCFMVGHR